MKRIITVIFLAACALAEAQSLKFSEFTNETSPAGTDHVVGYRTPGVVGGNRRFSLANLNTYFSANVTGLTNSQINSLAWAKITSTPTTLSGYGITDAQPLDADLTAIAALSTTGSFFYRSASNTWTPVTIGSGLSFASGTLSATGAGSGDMLKSTYDSNDDGVFALAQGGTGASTASGARTNLGLVIGTDVLAPSGSGASLTALNATQLTSGSIPAGRYASTTIPVAAINASGTANSSTYLRGDGSWSTPAGGGGSDALNANWSTSTTNVIVEGDSIGTGWTTTLLNAHAAFASKATTYNVAVSGSFVGGPGGSDAADIFHSSRYTAQVYPKRPAANGGSAGILESWIVLMIGTNNINIDDVAIPPPIIDRVQDYVTQAHGHGFKVAVCTIYMGPGFYLGGSPIPLIYSQRAYKYNAALLRGESGADLVIDVGAQFAGVNDTGIDPDHLHQSDEGKQRSVTLIGNTFLTPGIHIERTRSLAGVGDGATVTHDNFGWVPHAAVAAQGHQLQILTYNANQAWNLDTNPMAKLTLTGNVTTFSPTNMRAGFTYQLLLKQNSNTVSWDTAYFKERAGYTYTPSTGDVYDLHTFWSDGNYLYRMRVETGLDLNPPPEPGVLMSESFLQTGASSPGVDLDGTQADTVNVATNTWETDGYNASFNKGVTRKFDENVGVGSHYSITSYDTGVGNDFSVEIEVTDKSTSFNGLSYLVFKSNVNPTTGSTPCMAVSWSTAYNYVKLSYFDEGLADATPTEYWTGAIGDLVNGDVLKVSVESNTTCKVYINATLKTTQTITSALNGYTVVGLKLDQGTKVTNFKVKDLTP